MAWTAPRTWVVGEIVTASQMNTHVRDQLRYLKGLSGAIVIEDAVTFNSTVGVSGATTLGVQLTVNPTGANPGILVNHQGTGDVLQLQDDGVNRCRIGNGGWMNLYMGAAVVVFSVNPNGAASGIHLNHQATGPLMDLKVTDVSKFTVSNAGALTLTDNIVMTAGKTVDGVDVSNIPTTYMPLAGGTFAGNVVFAAGGTQIYKSTDNSYFIISGGLTTAPAIQLTGKDHANAGDIRLFVTNTAKDGTTNAIIVGPGDIPTVTFNANITMAAGRTVDGVDLSDGSTYATHGAGQHTDRTIRKFIPAHACFSDTVNVVQELGAGVVSWWKCPDGQSALIQTHYYIDVPYVSSFVIYACWLSSAAAGNLYYHLGEAHAADGEAFAINRAATAAVATSGASLLNIDTLATGGEGAVAVGDMVALEFQRSGGDALDTLAADVLFLGFVIQFTKDQ